MQDPNITHNVLPDEMPLFPQPIKRLIKLGHRVFDQFLHETPSEHFIPFEEELYGTMPTDNT